MKSFLNFNTNCNLYVCPVMGVNVSWTDLVINLWFILCHVSKLTGEYIPMQVKCKELWVIIIFLTPLIETYREIESLQVTLSWLLFNFRVLYSPLLYYRLSCRWSNSKRLKYVFILRAKNLELSYYSNLNLKMIVLYGIQFEKVHLEFD